MQPFSCTTRQWSRPTRGAPWEFLASSASAKVCSRGFPDERASALISPARATLRWNPCRLANELHAHKRNHSVPNTAKTLVGRVARARGESLQRVSDDCGRHVCRRVDGYERRIPPALGAQPPVLHTVPDEKWGDEKQPAFPSASLKTGSWQRGCVSENPSEPLRAAHSCPEPQLPDRKHCSQPTPGNTTLRHSRIAVEEDARRRRINKKRIGTEINTPAAQF